MTDKRMRQASVSVLVELPLEQAWERLRDFSLPHNYVPRITRTEIVSEQREGVGAHRRVYSGKDYLEESVTEWREGEGFRIRLHKGKKPMAPFREALFDYALSENAPGQTRIDLALSFDMPWSVLGAKLADWVILPLMEKQLVQVAAGMKHFYESGERASDEDRKRLAEAVWLTSASD